MSTLTVYSMVQYTPCWDKACEGGRGSRPFATYVGKDSEKSKDSPDNVADGFEPSPPDESELAASKSLVLCDTITSSDAAATLPPREAVIVTFP